MRIIHHARDGAIEVKWMWLPTFIGQNIMIMSQLKEFLSKTFPPGKVEITEELLDDIHIQVIAWLVTRFPLPGMLEFLKGIEHVQEEADDKDAVQQKHG